MLKVSLIWIKHIIPSQIYYLQFFNYFLFFVFLIDRAKKLKTALFMVGEIGGNDYNFAFLQGKTIEEARDMVPEVVQAIKDAVTVSFPSKQNKFLLFFFFFPSKMTCYDYW